MDEKKRGVSDWTDADGIMAVDDLDHDVRFSWQFVGQNQVWRARVMVPGAGGFGEHDTLFSGFGPDAAAALIDLLRSMNVPR